MNQQQRSTFVNVLAWIFIILAGFATLISLLQNIMISVMFPVEEMNKAFSEPQVQQEMPLFAEVIFSNLQLVFVIFFAVSSTTFVSAIGLLKRKNWGRIVFMVMMCLGICWNVVALILQNAMFTSMPQIPANQMDTQFGTMMTVMKVVTFVIAMGISYLFGWIIYRLSSDKIKAEFIFTPSTMPGSQQSGMLSAKSNKNRIILTASVVFTAALGVFYFSTGNIQVGMKYDDIQELAMSGDDLRLANLLGEQPDLANATREKTGWTPLHGAACNGHTECVRLLINAAANVNVQACNKFTPLHCASEDGYAEIVELLLIANADPNMQDSEGKTPLDWAMWKNHKEIVKRLKEYGGKTNAEINRAQETSNWN